ETASRSCASAEPGGTQLRLSAMSGVEPSGVRRTAVVEVFDPVGRLGDIVGGGRDFGPLALRSSPVRRKYGFRLQREHRWDSACSSTKRTADLRRAAHAHQI